MTVQEVARNVMKATNTSQTEVAKRAGLTGQSTVSMFLQSKSMRVEAFLKILNACGYELVARSVDGVHPEYVVGDDISKNDNRIDEDYLNRIVRQAVSEALLLRDATTPVSGERDVPESDVSEKSAKNKKGGR